MNTRTEPTEPTLAQAKRIHFVGIGGIGLSSIARVLASKGKVISGSDSHRSEITDTLAAEGIEVYIGHQANNVGNADLLVVTSAVTGVHPELEAAKARGIRVAKRPEILGELTQGYRTIAVGGTHGKTTTTAMLANILVDAGQDPTVIVGGISPGLGSNARFGRGEYFVIEADEYDRTFLTLEPEVAVITSIEYDHPDIYPSEQDYISAFTDFAQRAQPKGAVVINGDSNQIAKALGRVRAPIIRYGFAQGCDYRVVNWQPVPRGGSRFHVCGAEGSVGQFELSVPGKHNVMNALAALTGAHYLGVSIDVIRTTLASYEGAARRFQITAEVGGITIIDDYAHHPTEIRASLGAVREKYPGQPVWAVFQPHTFSRTRALLADFADAFVDADHVIVTEIYASRESDDGQTRSQHLARRMVHPDVRLAKSLEQAVDDLSNRLSPGDVLITLGAGDVNEVGLELARRIARQRIRS